jgi:diguanylate cyclase (GGDEF)-like protein
MFETNTPLHATALASAPRFCEHEGILSMDINDSAFLADGGVPLQGDLRQQIASALLQQVETITSDSVAIFPFSGAEALDRNYCHRLGHLLTQLLAVAVRDGRLDPRGGFVGDLHRIVLERALTMERLFTFVYLTERTTLDEIALHEDIGATTEPWPVVAQLVRRASFDLLAAYADRAQLEPSHAAVDDKLTTLHTRPVLDAVMAKEAECAGRFGYPISLILFDVDRLSAINQEHGYRVGDKILERLGILIRTYFRQYDWVARHADDSIAVLLTHTAADDAAALAERVRASVEERLGFTDHRTDTRVLVTLSVAVVNVTAAKGNVIDPERLLANAEAAVDIAKRLGRNRVERIDGYSGDTVPQSASAATLRTLPHNSPSA